MIQKFNIDFFFVLDTDRRISELFLFYRIYLCTVNERKCNNNFVCEGAGEMLDICVVCVC